MTVFEITTTVITLFAFLSTLVMIFIQLKVYSQEWTPLLICENVEVIIKECKEHSKLIIKLELRNVGKPLLYYKVDEYKVTCDEAEVMTSSKHIGKYTLIASNRYMKHVKEIEIKNIMDGEHLEIEVLTAYKKIKLNRVHKTKVNILLEYVADNPKILEMYNALID